MEEKKEEIEKKTENLQVDYDKERPTVKNTPKLQSILHSSYNEGKKQKENPKKFKSKNKKRISLRLHSHYSKIGIEEQEYQKCHGHIT